jgi:acetamidase/formamidase
MVSFLMPSVVLWLFADCALGYNDYQIYLLLSCAPVQGHVAGIVGKTIHLHIICETR